MMQASVHHVDWRGQGGSCEMGYLGTTSRSMDPRGFFEFGERCSDESMHSPQGGGFFLDDVKRRERTKRQVSGYTLQTSDFYTDDTSHDLFDMSSFFREHETLKTETDEYTHLSAEFSGGQIPVSETENQKDSLLEGQDDSTDTGVETMMDVSDSSVDSVVMGIPYYVACQWQQMQQQQQQQQQAVMMLWWQAYLSGAYNMLGPTTATSQLGWSLPAAGLAALHGACTSFGEDAFYQQMLMMDDKGQGMTHGTKRRRKNDAPHDAQANGTKKGRRPRHDERVCKNCGTNETPFWRKDKQDGLPLCNACGLYLSKNDAPRPKALWKMAEKSAATPVALSAPSPTAAPVAASNTAIVS